MQAALLIKPATFKITNIELPEIVNGWPRIRVASCGICGSDLAIYNRNPPIPKFWPGHEIAGFIGDELVAVNPLISCDQCDFCVNGKENLCTLAKMISHHLPGGFAEYVAVPSSNIRYVHTTVARATCIEPLASSLHMLEIGQVKRGDKVVIIGGGTIGLMLVQLTYLRGAEAVKLITRHAFQSDLGKKWGAVDDDFEPSVVLVATAGDGSALEQAVNIARPNGRIILLGNIYKSRSLNLKWLVEHELSVFGSQRYLKSDFEMASNLIESEKVEIDPLITHQFALSNIPLAYSTAKNKAKHHSIKVLVNPIL